jgi:hypothetical protein
VAPAVESVEAYAESLLPVAWWSQCHCAVAARSNLRESGAATMSALNLWNKNTERVAHALSSDTGSRTTSPKGARLQPNSHVLNADNLPYVT